MIHLIVSLGSQSEDARTPRTKTENNLCGVKGIPHVSHRRSSHSLASGLRVGVFEALVDRQQISPETHRLSTVVCWQGPPDVEISYISIAFVNKAGHLAKRLRC